MHDAPVPVIVVHGVVLRAAVIPERQRARAPLEAAGELGLDLVAEKKREQWRAFRFGHAAGKVFEHIRHSHSRSSNSGFAATLAGFDGDDLAIIHAAMITKQIHLAR